MIVAHFVAENNGFVGEEKYGVFVGKRTHGSTGLADHGDWIAGLGALEKGGSGNGIGWGIGAEEIEELMKILERTYYTVDWFWVFWGGMWEWLKNEERYRSA